MKNVLVVGPSVERTKGGMATVISSQIESNSGAYGYSLEIVVSHVEGSKAEKLKYLIRSAIKLLLRRHVSLVHIHMAADASFYRKSILALVCRMRRVPVIIHVHGSDFDEFYQRIDSLSKRWLRHTFKSCKKVLVLSKYWQEFFNQNITSHNVELLYNGVDVSGLKRISKSPSPLHSFLFLGRLGQRKGVYDLLDAIDIIVNKNGQSHLSFFLAGDGDLDEVSSIIKSRKLHQNVTVLGWLSNEEKNIWFEKVSTVLLPSYSEGLPMALLEAMACGKVIISSKVGGIPELVEDNKNGFLISPGDVNALVRHIMYVAEHPDEMKKIAESNIDKIDKNYNLDTINKRLYAIYSEALL